MTKRRRKPFWAKLLSGVLVVSMLIGTVGMSTFAADDPAEDVKVEATADNETATETNGTAGTPEESEENVNKGATDAAGQTTPETTDGGEALTTDDASKTPDTDTSGGGEADTVPTEQEEADDAQNVLPEEEAAQTEYATIEEFMAACAEMGYADDEKTVRAVIDNCLSIYERLSDEDKANPEVNAAYEALLAYANELDNGENGINPLANELNKSGTCEVKIYAKAGYGVTITNTPALGYWPVTLKKDEVGSNNATFYGTLFFEGDNTNGWTAYVEWTCGNAEGVAGPFGTIKGRDMSGVTKSNSTGVSFSSSQSKSTLTVGTIYSSDGKTIFTLNYNANGGTGAPEKQTATSTASSYTFTISNDKPTRDGFEFLGWSTSATAIDPSYYVGGTIKVTGTTTLYAVWKEEETTPTSASYTVQWYTQEGDLIKQETRSGTLNNMVSVKEEDKKDIIVEKELSENSPAGTYIFDSNNQGNITSATLAASGTVLRLYFTKDEGPGNEPDEIKVTWKDGYTDIPIKVEEIERGGDYSELYPEDPTREEYIFDGWSDPEEDDDGNITITAQWKLESGETDNGKGISIEKTRYSINGDEEVTIAEVGDVIVWNIKVTNNSNVVKTVKLTEQLTGATLNKTEVTLEPGTFEFVAATYTVTGEETLEDGKLINTVIGETDKETEKVEKSDPGTEVEGHGDDKEDEKAKLKITKVADKQEVAKDRDVSYTITVTNESNAAAKDVTVTDTLPDGLEFKEFALSAGMVGTHENNVCIVKIGDIPAGESRNFVITATVTAEEGKSITNKATVTCTNLEGSDPEDEETIEVVEQEKPVEGNLEVEKHLTSAEKAKVGDTITWTIRITNNSDKKRTINVSDELNNGEKISLEKEVLEILAHGTVELNVSYVVQDSDKGEKLKNHVVVTDPGDPDDPDDPEKEYSADSEETEIVEDEDIPEEEQVDITIKYVYVDEDGTETEIKETVNVPVKKGEAYDVSSLIPGSIEDGDVTYKKDTVEGDVAGEADEDKEIKVLYKLGESESENPDPDPENPNPTDPVTPPGGGGGGGNNDDDDDDDSDPTPASTSDPTPPTPPTPTIPGPTVTPTPVPPTPTPTVSTVTPVPPTPTAALVTADPEMAQLVDEIVPLAGGEKADGVDEPSPVELDEEGVPMAGKGLSWALVNFALMNLAVFESLMLLIGYFIKTKNGSEEDEEEKKKLKKKGIMRVISLPVAIISIIAFCLTEDITLPTAFVDRYTLLMAIIALVQTAVVALSRKELEDEEEEVEVEA